jgi:hypothetical protein
MRRRMLNPKPDIAVDDVQTDNYILVAVSRQYSAAVMSSMEALDYVDHVEYSQTGLEKNYPTGVIKMFITHGAEIDGFTIFRHPAIMAVNFYYLIDATIYSMKDAFNSNSNITEINLCTMPGYNHKVWGQCTSWRQICKGCVSLTLFSNSVLFAPSWTYSVIADNCDQTSLGTLSAILRQREIQYATITDFSDAFFECTSLTECELPAITTSVICDEMFYMSTTTTIYINTYSWTLPSSYVDFINTDADPVLYINTATSSNAWSTTSYATDGYIKCS